MSVPWDGTTKQLLDIRDGKVMVKPTLGDYCPTCKATIVEIFAERRGLLIEAVCRNGHRTCVDEEQGRC